ncbi:MAG: hypothetical protein HC861_00150 [Rhodospirillaceae bacterium]|nr:hypothetical protein [Rhodospirillaceae bacterium]
MAALDEAPSFDVPVVMAKRVSLAHFTVINQAFGFLAHCCGPEELPGTSDTFACWGAG